MSTKMAIIMSLAVALSAVGSLSSHACARNSRRDLNGDAASYQNSRGQIRTDLLKSRSVIHGEHPSQPDTRPDWIDDPVSPGG